VWLVKIATLLKAGGLAFDVINHPSAQQLTKIVHGGIRRRASAAPGAQPFPHGRDAHALVRGRLVEPPRQASVGDLLKHVTPENFEKARQWHGIIRSFFSTED
jgi:hypothetical protein